MRNYYLIVIVFLAACSNKPSSVQTQPRELPVIQIRSDDATIYASYPAAVEGAVNIEIRPQITGILSKIYVDDGAYVTKGAPIFKIDDAPFIERLNNAKASLHAAIGALNHAQLEIDKLTPLVSNKVVADIQLKTAESNREMAMGNVERARAEVQSAEIDLGYTLIRSPLSGYIGRLLRKQGSIVGPADPSPLTELSDVHEVHVFFALGEYDFIRFKSQYAGKTLADKIQKLPPVELILADDSAYEKTGRVDLINGQFDKNTGAILVRATFENGDGLLRSGNTGKIKMGLKLTNQLIVPQAATLEMQDKTFVFFVGDSNKVIKRPITISGKSGTNYLVNDGLKPGDRIVYRGYDHLKEGDVIVPKPVDTSSTLVANN